MRWAFDISETSKKLNPSGRRTTPGSKKARSAQEADVPSDELTRTQSEPEKAREDKLFSMMVI